jgi:hypothetical protein
LTATTTDFKIHRAKLGFGIAIPPTSLLVKRIITKDAVKPKEEFMISRSVTLLCTSFLMLIWVALPAHAATTTCSYDFTTGSGNNYLSYCVTVNGNILQIQTPFGQSMLGTNGEGYGLCDQNVQAGGVNYTDYAVSDTGNWKNAVVLTHSLTSVKIARTTSDGHWTLTQTITLVPKTFSITVVMALTNHQSVSDVAYLVRFADAEPPTASSSGTFWAGALNSALARTVQPDPNYGLQLSNMGIPPFGFWQGYAQFVNTGPNACAFAFNEIGDNFHFVKSGESPESIEMAYVGSIGAGQTKTVTLSYHGL